MVSNEYKLVCKIICIHNEKDKNISFCVSFTGEISLCMKLGIFACKGCVLSRLASYLHV